MSQPKGSVKTNPKLVLAGFLVSALLIIGFFFLKASWSDVVDLPQIYLLIALVPTVLGLILGGYVSSLKAGDYTIDFNLTHRVEADMLVPAAGEKALVNVEVSDWDARDEYENEYAATGHYMLAHVFIPSTEPRQKFEVFIFVVRHERGSKRGPRESLPEIESAEFCFGPNWEYQPFLVTRESGGTYFGVRTHAWGTFFVLCRITVIIPETNEREEILLHRFIDFSMARGDG